LDGLRHFGQVQPSFTGRVGKLLKVSRLQRALHIKVERSGLGLKRQRVQLATDRLGFAQLATHWPQVFATRFNAHAAMVFCLLQRQRHFQGWIVFIHMAAPLALGAKVKKHRQGLIFS
jgi:hypothetical protein